MKIKILIIISLILSLFLFVAGCKGASRVNTYVIGRDPTWYPLDLMGKQNNVYGFSTDLFQAVAKIENLLLQLDSTGWNQIIPGLKSGTFDGALTSMTPTPMNEADYDFSEPFLSLGPVLIVKNVSPYHSLEDLSEKIVGVSTFNNSDELIVQKVGTIVIKPYENLSLALQDLSQGKIDGAVMGKVIAETYLKDLYRGQLRIATPPLNKKGLRLMVLHRQEIELIEAFNRGLEQIKRDGTYRQLLEKWNLSN